MRRLGWRLNIQICIFVEHVLEFGVDNIGKWGKARWTDLALLANDFQGLSSRLQLRGKMTSLNTCKRRIKIIGHVFRPLIGVFHLQGE